jgi:hypothetical protein
MTNEEVMAMMTDMGLHEGGMDNWVTDNAWWKFANVVYEQAFVNGTQKQMQSSVDKAVNAMTQPTYFIPSKDQRTWVGLTKTVVGNYLRRHALGDQPTFRQGFKEGVAFAEAKLKEKNT